MKTIVKISIVVLLLASVGGIIVLKNSTSVDPNKESAPVVAETAKSEIPALESPKPGAEAVPSVIAPLPRLVDLGSGKCIPCKMMAPILEELKKEYQGKFKVEFLDVWQIQGIAEQYGIQVIPTQIFYEPTGKELFRHEGFYSKEDILNKWKELGIQL